MPGDVTMSSDGSTLYVTGLNASGDAAIFSIDAGTGAVAEVFSGDPLVDPAALDLSPDDATLYVVDSLAADGLGAVLVFGVSGWTYDDELASGFDIAFPGGVAADDSGSMLLYTSISSGALTSLMTDGSGFEVLDTSSLLDLPAGVAVSGEMAYVADLSSDASSDVFLLTY
jgi:DNA-binding beta-propeller fold protein YncE